MINNALSIKNVNLYYTEKNKRKRKHALKNINLELNSGEVIGIIGVNGSGKTTLLKLIAGIFSSDTGSVNLHKNKVALISNGAGLQSDLTGIENIYQTGMLLGFKKNIIQSKIDEIIEFSELGDAIQKEVKTYSSGMHSRLAFAITVILQTDIILIDEILSAGDAKFKKKSLEKINEIIKDSSKTVIIVSHNHLMLKKICSKLLWLDNGIIKDIGAPKDVLYIYESVTSVNKNLNSFLRFSKKKSENTYELLKESLLENTNKKVIVTVDYTKDEEMIVLSSTMMKYLYKMCNMHLVSDYTYSEIKLKIQEMYNILKNDDIEIILPRLKDILRIERQEKELIININVEKDENIDSHISLLFDICRKYSMYNITFATNNLSFINIIKNKFPGIVCNYTEPTE